MCIRDSLSSIFNGDDAFDAGRGYQGKGQFMFAMLGDVGDHGVEASGTRADDTTHDAQPRSHPAWYSMTILGGGSKAARRNRQTRAHDQLWANCRRKKGTCSFFFGDKEHAKTVVESVVFLTF